MNNTKPGALPCDGCKHLICALERSIVCGGREAGCHDGWHGGCRYTARWEWEKPEYESMWESGLLLMEHGPHSQSLYDYGRWVITDKKLGVEWPYPC